MYLYLLCLVAQNPLMCPGLPTVETARSHSVRHTTLGKSQRLIPDDRQHSQETDIHASGGIRTHNPSKGAAGPYCVEGDTMRINWIYYMMVFI
jgi:hypothetical protein